ncbi:hypothetical protein OPV22_007853 [Ensete ventricosum]|uniref:Uncharacterized protein n=1 Tax=Ensete ventricosum TaxID=4639 RepID=A0AAV8RBE4_ENSVE|nr:hypothetical protein OPV22_007853 [Ensete ventricosum]
MTTYMRLELTWTGLGHHDASDDKRKRERERESVLASITDSTASRSPTVRRPFTGTRSTSPSPIGSAAIPRSFLSFNFLLKRLQLQVTSSKKSSLKPFCQTLTIICSICEETWKTCLADQRINCNFIFPSDSIISPICITPLLILH